MNQPKHIRSRAWTRIAFGAALLASGVLAMPTQALAGPYDLALRGLGRPLAQSTTDPAYERYRSLMFELGSVMATRPLAPAETLGISGFEFALVSTHAGINESASYWQGQPGSPVMLGVADRGGVPDALWVPTLNVRKGLPMSTELGITASYLAYSSMFLLGAETKITWHESFFRWVPAIASRFAFGSLFGTNEVKLNTLEYDTLVSLPIGIGGTWKLTPYFGHGLLFIDVISGVIDETPFDVTDRQRDQNGKASGSLYIFERMHWHENQAHRFFFGLRGTFAFLEVMYEVDITTNDVTNDFLQSHSIKFGFDT